MKYYVTSDVHGFYTPLREALTNAGYFDDDAPHKLLIAGDLFNKSLCGVRVELARRDEIDDGLCELLLRHVFRNLRSASR